MANMQMEKTPMPEQDPKVRAHNFEEVSQGYTAEMAINEAKRCLNCKHKPCVSGCPVNVPIPDFIAKMAEGDFAGAYEVISTTNALPGISGRVCPQENQCEAKCVRGVKGEPVPSAVWSALLRTMPVSMVSPMPWTNRFPTARRSLSSALALPA